MNLLTGESWNSLDDKGRLSLPVRLRNGHGTSSFVITRGIDSCLWLFPPTTWEHFQQELLALGNLFDPNARLVQRRLLAPAQEVEVDRLGRILVPQSLREYAKLVKECIILGMPNHIEIWDTTVYAAYLEATEPSFSDVTTSFARMPSLREEKP